MSAYQILLTELDRCDYIVDYQYTGCLSDYTYNGVTYAETSEAYSRRLERLYLDFLNEWSTLSEADKQAAKGMMELIVAKRYSYGTFFFDVPTLETVNAMAEDSGVSRQSVKMARFVSEMAGCQKFYLLRTAQFFGITGVGDEQPPVVVEVMPVQIEQDNGSENTEGKDVTYSDIDDTIYQALYKEYGSTMSVKQLCKVFNVQSRTIYNWEQKGYITNVNQTSDETTSSGHKKRGEEKRYLTSDVARSIELRRKLNEL